VKAWRRNAAKTKAEFTAMTGQPAPKGLTRWHVKNAMVRIMASPSTLVQQLLIRAGINQPQPA
jgi:hypothetical protein